MNAEKTMITVLTVICVAALFWKAQDYLRFPNVITPPPEPEDKPISVPDTTGTWVNDAISPGINQRMVYGPLMFLPPSIPWSKQRGYMP